MSMLKIRKSETKIKNIPPPNVKPIAIFIRRNSSKDEGERKILVNILQDSFQIEKKTISEARNPFLKCLIF